MSSAVSRPPLPTGGPSAGGDEFDDLNDYDIELDDPTDPFGNNYQVPQDKNATSKSDSAREGGRSGDGLGLDEEVEVTRKPRAPRVKLDEHRLLSAAGIPKLRKKAREHLKFKGKGHEYSDASRLLAFYQLWLDDLFPKARFLDALAMVEKMGHKKMMQSARMEWINEGKPHSGVHEDSLFDEPQIPARDGSGKTAERVAPIFEKAKEGERAKTPSGNVDDLFGGDEDIYGATPKATRTQATAPAVGGGTSLFGPAKDTGGDEEFPDDDIDVLLAEEESMRTSKPAAKAAVSQDEDMDDMDALLAEEEAMRVEKPAATTKNPPGGQNDDDMDDVDALLAEEEAMRTEKPRVATKPVVRSEGFDDDLEAMAEMDGMWD